MKELQVKTSRAALSSKTIKKLASPMKVRPADIPQLSKIRRVPFNKLKKKHLLMKKDQPFLYRTDASATSSSKIRLLPLKCNTEQPEDLPRTLSKL